MDVHIAASATTAKQQVQLHDLPPPGVGNPLPTCKIAKGAARGAKRGPVSGAASYGGANGNGGQNVGNSLGDRNSSRVLAPPGGFSSVTFG